MRHPEMTPIAATTPMTTQMRFPPQMCFDTETA